MDPSKDNQKGLKADADKLKKSNKPELSNIGCQKNSGLNVSLNDM